MNEKKKQSFFDSEQLILSILQESASGSLFDEMTQKEETAAADDTPSVPDTVITEPVTVEETAQKKGFSVKNLLHGILPHKEDPVSEIVRKCLFCLSLIVFIVSLSLVTYYMIIEPRQVQNDTTHYMELYTDPTVENTTDGYNYPTGMLPNFRKLYDINPDIAGFLSYTSTDKASFLNIHLPVVHCDNNDTYLNHAFDKSKSRSGTLFFNKDNVIEPGKTNRVSIIYGHNMASGAMFANLNKLMRNVHYARSAPFITLNTIYQNNQYEVFAVILCDEDATAENYFSYLRTSFADDGEFLNFVAELRARSLYNYPTDVQADDELLILSTCTNKSQSKLKNGRLAVIARRVRDDETVQNTTAHISVNSDVIMPYAWYTAQNLKPHAFYTIASYHVPEDTILTTTTATQATTTAATTTTTTTPTSAVNSDTTTTADQESATTTTAAATTTTAGATTTTEATGSTTTSPN